MRDIHDLLDRYWQLAYAEGRENRQHDTENGDAQECRSAIDASFREIRTDLRAKETEAIGYLRAVGELKRRVAGLERALRIERGGELM